MCEGSHADTASLSSSTINENERILLLPAGAIGGLDNCLRFWVDLNRGNIITSILDLHFPYDLVVPLLQCGFEHIALLDCGGLGNCLVPGHGLLDVAADLGK